MDDDIEKLDRETAITLHAYLLTFGGRDGRRVLDDLRKSWFDKAFDESRFNDIGYLAARAAEHNCFIKILRCMQRGAELVQKTEGVEPSHTPDVITDFEAEENP